MSRRIAGFISTGLSLLTLAGCGLGMFAQREPWRSEAEDACLARKLVRATAYTEPSRAINGPGVCGMDHPFRVSAFSNGSVALASRAVLACPAISTVDAWIEDVVQPAAAAYFGAGIAEMKAGSYSCRSQNGQRGARISEHAFGNAVDVMAFRLTDGREVTVARGWRGEPAEQGFLREVFLGACRHFTTVLAPGSDAFHYDHIHMDLARHGGQRRICKPVIKFAPQTPTATAPGYPLQARPGAGNPQPAAGPPGPANLDEDMPEDGSVIDEGQPALAPARPVPVHAAPANPPAPLPPARRPGEFELRPPRPIGTGLY